MFYDDGMELNSEQQAIIDRLSGVYLINAPVGTGKTMVLTRRVAAALNHGFTAPRILCLTFTNRAAEEMRSRLAKVVPDRAAFDELTVCTFHAWCAQFLKQEAKLLGLASDFSILDEDEQILIIKQTAAAFEKDLYLDDSRGLSAYRNLIENLYQYRWRELEHRLGFREAPAINKLHEALAVAYERALSEQHALDFHQLVLQTVAALYDNDDLRNKWSQRYDFIQLDEFQDTHLSEYLVVKELAKRSKNLTLIGDLDQTIYSWRGSRPQLIASLFKSHFAPVNEMSLSVNYRSRPEILEAAQAVLSARRFVAPAGDGALTIFNAHNFQEEIDYSVNKIKELTTREPQARLAVLARSNGLITQIAEIFQERRLPHLTVDHYQFFRRQEVKDALAHIKILLNRFDLDSAHRLALRPPKDLGEATIGKIRGQGEELALRVSDFLHLPNFSRGEPFVELLNDYERGRLVVLDTETTGFNPARDEVIQVYARELIKGEPVGELHLYLKNSRPVGASAAIHGLTDEFLAANGREPGPALACLKDFIGQSAVIGHNVHFDLAMLGANGERQGVEFIFKNFYDTLDLARRLIKSNSYKLSVLADMFNLAGATHSADDDVDATIGLLSIVVAKLRVTGAPRAELFGRYAKKFIRLASQLTSWQHLLDRERPALALEKIITDSGLKDYYAKSGDAEKRLSGLEALVNFCGQRDVLSQSPRDSWRELLSLAALSKNVDFVALNEGQTPILTIHQVKGLEFDHVFVVGLNEGQLPWYRARNEASLAEEKRLLYVAMTRARQSATLTCSDFDRFGRRQPRSRFLSCLGA